MNKDTRLSDVLHVLLHLDQTKTPVISDVLAKSMGTNPAVFRRTMAGLRNAGYVTSGKGHGGGWQLAVPLHEITLLDIYTALERPNLFAIGSRSLVAECKIERQVSRVLAETLAQAEALFMERFQSITLDKLVPTELASRALRDER